jgi:hypothetical protein
MNLSLGFPDFSKELSVPPKESLEAVVSYFRSAHKEPNSAVRDIHRDCAAASSPKCRRRWMQTCAAY